MIARCKKIALEANVKSLEKAKVLASQEPKRLFRNGKWLIGSTNGTFRFTKTILYPYLLTSKLEFAVSTGFFFETALKS